MESCCKKRHRQSIVTERCFLSFGGFLMAKDDLAARRAELYEAYDEAALRILLDRYGETCAEGLLAEEETLLSAPEAHAPDTLDLKMARTLEGCVKKKKRARLEKRALRLGSRVAVVLVALGAVLSLSGFPIHAAREEEPPRWEETISPADAEEETPEPTEEEEVQREESRGTRTDETETRKAD